MFSSLVNGDSVPRGMVLAGRPVRLIDQQFQF